MCYLRSSRELTPRLVDAGTQNIQCLLREGDRASKGATPPGTTVKRSSLVAIPMAHALIQEDAFAWVFRRPCLRECHSPTLAKPSIDDGGVGRSQRHLQILTVMADIDKPRANIDEACFKAIFNTKS